MIPFHQRMAVRRGYTVDYDLTDAKQKRKMPVSNRHAALGTTTQEPFPPNTDKIMFGMGCYWGAEQKFWQIMGVHSTQAGFAGGSTVNPTYHEVCTGLTNHAEVTRVVYEPDKIDLRDLLRVFWEWHDPTQLWGQGKDKGAQYRSCIIVYTEDQLKEAMETREFYQKELKKAGRGTIVTEIRKASRAPFYYADDSHQQYLWKNKDGYCGLALNGVRYPSYHQEKLYKLEK